MVTCYMGATLKCVGYAPIRLKLRGLQPLKPHLVGQAGVGPCLPVLTPGSGHTMPWTDILSPAIVIAVVVMLWRDTNSRIAGLGATVTALAATVADVDRRLATLEGRITGWQDQRHGTAQ